MTSSIDALFDLSIRNILLSVLAVLAVVFILGWRRAVASRGDDDGARLGRNSIGLRRQRVIGEFENLVVSHVP